MKLIIIIAVVLIAAGVGVALWLRSGSKGGGSSDSKMILKDIYEHYAQNTTANIIDVCENESRISRYSVVCSFCYDGKRGRTPCMFTIYTDDSSVRDFEEQIPLVVIPPYLDYKRSVMTKKELLETLGHTFNVNNKKAFPMAVYEKDADAFM